MASQVRPIKKTYTGIQALTPGRRLFLILLVCSIQAVYIPTSNRLSGGIEPRLPIDIVPVWAVWVVPYVLCYALWVGGLLHATLRMNDRMFRAFIASFFITCLASALTFIFFPTYVRAATFHGEDVFTSLLRFIHENWGRYSALPSGHVYITTMLAIFYQRWYPRQRIFWIATVIVVSLSTLFTAQHYIADVIAGLLVAHAGYLAGSRLVGFVPARVQAAGPRIVD